MDVANSELHFKLTIPLTANHLNAGIYNDDV